MKEIIVRIPTAPLRAKRDFLGTSSDFDMKT